MEPTLKKILAAVDGSPPSLHAARLAQQLARGMGASLAVAYSVPPLVLPGDLPMTWAAEALKAEQARGTLLLGEVAKELGTAGVVTLRLEGPAAEQIADLAERDGYDLVVVGSRGRNAVARVLLGSVADRLVHICKKPVLVVR